MNWQPRDSYRLDRYLKEPKRRSTVESNKNIGQRGLPVKSLPAPSWEKVGLGLLSAVFDNIPLTALAIYQGRHDWGILAFTLGYGGSLIWFGSSAGAAISNMFPESKNSLQWMRLGWHVPFAYLLSFLVLLAVAGWRP